jgi:hypothetical protein
MRELPAALAGRANIVAGARDFDVAAGPHRSRKDASALNFGSVALVS